MNLSVPTRLEDVDRKWLINLVCLVDNINCVEDVKVVQYDMQIQPNTDGVLSDICKVHIDVEAGSEVNSEGTCIISHQWFLKVVPKRFKQLVTKHRLFEKEIAFYSQVMPTLEAFMLSKNPDFRLQNFHLPHFVYGDVTSKGEGVLVLEDVSIKGYDTINSISMLMDAESLMASSMALAEFHGLCIAFDQSSPIKLRQLFPIFDPSRLMWVQKDMLHFLSKISQSAAKFLKSLDSLEPDLWQKFTNCSMTNPSQILKEELSRVSPWQSLQHGDSWHNNFLLNKIDVHVVDWQVAYFGHGPADLCYLILSSSTSATRIKHFEHILHAYYDTLIKTTEALEVAFNPSYEDLKLEYIASIPYCILFCANAEDFVPDTVNGVQGDVTPPFVASDAQMELFDAGHVSKDQLISDKMLLKGIRRRNFMDICREAVSYNLLR